MKKQFPIIYHLSYHRLTHEPGNPEDLREKLARLLAQPEQTAEMGRNARRMVREEFGADIHYERLMQVYENAAMAANK